jgi:hypothetical protein
MTIAEWFNSDPVKDFRIRALGNSRLSECQQCYVEEDSGGNSRRFRSNQKSVIFIQAFKESFAQSPGRNHFDASGHTVTQPIDVHIDLGNYCNLACKMCNAQASSRIAAQEVKWGIESSRPFIGSNWTSNQKIWNSFKQQLLAIPKLNNIHLMGGETLLTDRFEDLIDTFISHDRFDVCWSFVTNGTVFKSDLLDKLSRFHRVGIEVSIESIGSHNAYQRQGTDTKLVLNNIDRYIDRCNNSNITLTLRPAISALTIGHVGELFQYALEKKLIIKSLQVTTPRFLNVEILPHTVKQQYINQFQHILDQLNSIELTQDYNVSDPNNYKLVVYQQVKMCMNMLLKDQPTDVEYQHQLLVSHCKKWDTVYQYDARELYPELTEIWDQYGY